MPTTPYLEQSVRQGFATVTQQLTSGILPPPSSTRDYFTGLAQAVKPSPKPDREIVQDLIGAKDERAFFEIIHHSNLDLQAARANLAAARLEVPQATALEITLSQYAGFLEKGGLTIPVPGLFPFPGIMSQKLGIARANGRIAALQVAMAGREMLAAGAQLVVRVWFLQHLATLIREDIQLADDIHRLALRLYKDGRVDFSDVVGTRVRKDLLSIRLLDIRNQLAALAVKGGSLAGIRDFPLAALPKPVLLMKIPPAMDGVVGRRRQDGALPTDPPAIDGVVGQINAADATGATVISVALRQRQELRILDARLVKIDAMLAMVTRMTVPDLALSPTLPMSQGAGDIRSRMGGLSSRSGMAGMGRGMSSGQGRPLMVRSHPAFGFFQAIIGQMQQLRQNVSLARAALELKIRAELAERFAGLETARDALEITRKKIIPDLLASVRSLMTRYENGRVPFADVVQAETRWIDGRRGGLEAHRDLLLAQIGLRAAQGLGPIEEIQP